MLLAIGRGSSTLAPDFLTEFVLSALSATNLTILVALAFVLARNIVKLVVERRRALPFARFRAKLVAVLLGMTVVPAVLVLIVGSELIRNSVDRWFNAPMDEMLTSANAIAGDYYRSSSVSCRRRPSGLRAHCGSSNLDGQPVRRPRSRRARRRCRSASSSSRCIASRPADGRSQVTPVVDIAAPSLPPAYSRASADRLAERTAAGADGARIVEQLATAEI